MSNLALKKARRKQSTSLSLVEQIEIKNGDDKKWFRCFLNSILSSPDLDYSQFERLESKRTARQMRMGWD
jgi:uncharacterized membrane protein